MTTAFTTMFDRRAFHTASTPWSGRGQSAGGTEASSPPMHGEVVVDAAPLRDADRRQRLEAILQHIEGGIAADAATAALRDEVELASGGHCGDRVGRPVLAAARPA